MRAPATPVPVEAVARALAGVLQRVARYADKLPEDAALSNALRPLDRLCAPPTRCVRLDGAVSFEEAATQVRLALENSEASLCRTLCTAAVVENLLGKFVRNAHGFDANCGEGEAAPAAGIFMLFCVMNHACEPNTEAIAAEKASIVVRTTRAVAAGEPLTNTYVPSARGSGRRRMLDNWGIECERTCELCWPPKRRRVE